MGDSTNLFRRLPRIAPASCRGELVHSRPNPLSFSGSRTLHSRSISSVVEVKSSGSEGTGICIEQNGLIYVATAGHVVKSQDYAEVHGEPCRSFVPDRRFDLAFLLVNSTDIPPIALALGVPYQTTLMRIAYRAGKQVLQPVVATMRISSQEAVQYAPVGWPGCSGAPLIDEEGRLVAIHTSSTCDFGYAIPVDAIRRLVSCIDTRTNQKGDDFGSG